MPNAKELRDFNSLMRRCVNELSDETWELLYEELKNIPSENIPNVLKKFLQEKEEEN
tara:strand:+ start:434 stop:604 length:171 start_codon:yes stop_codon:yes gene_type:complete